MSTKVLIADDHQIFREGLCSLLEREAGIELVGTASDGREAVEMAQRFRPDIVVLDIVMPVLNGIEAAHQIAAALPETRIIALSMHQDRRYVTGMLQAGATGYVVKDSAYEELATAINYVQDGQTFLSPAITSMVVQDFLATGKEPEEGPFHILTPREREVLQMIAEGLATKQIARTIGVSIKTIETYRRQIMAKLGIDSIAGLTKYAIREGLTSL